MTRERFAELLELATNGLADIASDGDDDARRMKAWRLYATIRAEWMGPGPDDDVRPPVGETPESAV